MAIASFSPGNFPRRTSVCVMSPDHRPGTEADPGEATSSSAPRSVFCASVEDDEGVVQGRPRMKASGALRSSPALHELRRLFETSSMVVEARRAGAQVRIHFSAISPGREASPPPPPPRAGPGTDPLHPPCAGGHPTAIRPSRETSSPFPAGGRNAEDACRTRRMASRYRFCGRSWG